MKKVAILLAEGFEELEAISPVDILRRAGIAVTTVSITKNKEVTGAHGIKIMADALFEEVPFADFEAIVLPGGMPGTSHLNEHQALKTVLTEFAESKKLIGAICAAPLVLGELGLLQKRNATCYPGFEKQLIGAAITKQAVVKDEHFITANGVGNAIPFALALVKELLNDEAANNLAQKMLVQ
ncbi:DJ-1 family glyoxalase III [Carboxylicivirga taeanensis]|uniref:DJ-1 family glyoxalase III n=1 Tax=Carboxylicivirga taeanensis TaxID=1416875 RepID=UPI003F6E280F